MFPQWIYWAEKLEKLKFPSRDGNVEAPVNLYFNTRLSDFYIYFILDFILDFETFILRSVWKTYSNLP